MKLVLIIKKNKQGKRLALFFMRVWQGVFEHLGFNLPKNIGCFFISLFEYRRLGGRVDVVDFYPCLNDRVSTTGIDAHYFHQAIWAFRKIVQRNMKSHVDVGSQVNFVGMLTAVTKVTFVDIRPLRVDIENYKGVDGSILDLPFPDASVDSISCLHVIEHIGLGRYGDPIDPDGAIKAAKELSRVIAPGGRAYISTPIGESRVQFNAQRIFGINELIGRFGDLQLVDFSVVEPSGHYREHVDPLKIEFDYSTSGADYALGMFEFMKPE